MIKVAAASNFDQNSTLMSTVTGDAGGRTTAVRPSHRRPAEPPPSGRATAVRPSHRRPAEPPRSGRTTAVRPSHRRQAPSSSGSG
jgi:hypothetical protein